MGIRFVIAFVLGFFTLTACFAQGAASAPSESSSLDIGAVQGRQHQVEIAFRGTGHTRQVLRQPAFPPAGWRWKVESLGSFSVHRGARRGDSRCEQLQPGEATPTVVHIRATVQPLNYIPPQRGRVICYLTGPIVKSVQAASSPNT